MNRNEEINPYGEEGSATNITVVKISGSVWLSVVSFGVAMLALGFGANVLLKNYADQAYVDKAANAAAAPASIRSQIAEREARVAQDQNHIQDGDIDSLKRRVK